MIIIQSMTLSLHLFDGSDYDDEVRIRRWKNVSVGVDGLGTVRIGGCDSLCMRRDVSLRLQSICLVLGCFVDKSYCHYCRGESRYRRDRCSSFVVDYCCCCFVFCFRCWRCRTLPHFDVVRGNSCSRDYCTTFGWGGNDCCRNPLILRKKRGDGETKSVMLPRPRLHPHQEEGVVSD